MVTVGQVLDSLETNLFSDSPVDDFEIKCRARELGIKEYIGLIQIMLNQFIERPGLSYTKLSCWKEEKIKTCVKNLIEYLEELVEEHSKEKIEKYCIGPNNFFFGKIPFFADTTLIMLNSYYGSVITDIYWIRDLTLFEFIEISKGEFDLTKLGKKTPLTIKQINNLLHKNSKQLVDYKNHLDTIDEAFKCYKKKYFKAFNLLLLTSIEGLTRKLGKYLIEKQGLNVDPFSEDYNSLDGFLRKIPWKQDLKAGKTTISLLTSNYKRVNYSDPNYNPSKTFEGIPITIKTRLDFLRRRFKENRDLVLHGQETEYNKPFHGFINVSALYEVIAAILECKDVYKD